MAVLEIIMELVHVHVQDFGIKTAFITSRLIDLSRADQKIKFFIQTFIEE
jgi:hypothetical protein